MEFHVALTQSVSDLTIIEEAIHALDPAAQIDMDTLNHKLRVAAHLDAGELLHVLDAAGYSVNPHQVTQLPSICCGGCGG